MKNPIEWSLLYGAIPALLTALGCCSLVYLAARRRGHWYSRTVPLIVVGTVLVVVLIQWLVDDVWHPFAGTLPITVLTWTGVTAGTLGLGVARLHSSSGLGRLLTACAVVLVILMALNHVNTFFGYYPNLRDALGLPFTNEISATQAMRPGGGDPATGSGPSLPAKWKSPNDLPKTGRVVEVSIPGTVSKFEARAAWLYLPPAYLTPQRALLPVLELIGGQPGTSRDWLNSNDLSGVMDRFASHHDGLAPVVVMPDALGSFWANPLCINSQLGQSDTYLAVDVPNWVRTHLTVDQNTATWAVGGGSFGGTCAWQLAVAHPHLFPTFMDFSGVYEQLRGTLQQTIDAAFNGDIRKFSVVNPAQILVHHERPDTWAVIGAGRTDSYYIDEVERTAASCRRAGMHVHFLTVPGGHDGQTFETLLADSMKWLAQRDGILPS